MHKYMCVLVGCNQDTELGQVSKYYVWSKPHASHSSINTFTWVKYGGGSVVFWDRLSFSKPGVLVTVEGRIEGTLLQESLLQSAVKKTKTKQPQTNTKLHLSTGKLEPQYEAKETWERLRTKMFYSGQVQVLI